MVRDSAMSGRETFAVQTGKDDMIPDMRRNVIFSEQGASADRGGA
jgi:hypothetical protein